MLCLCLRLFICFFPVFPMFYFLAPHYFCSLFELPPASHPKLLYTFSNDSQLSPQSLKKHNCLLSPPCVVSFIFHHFGYPTPSTIFSAANFFCVVDEQASFRQTKSGCKIAVCKINKRKNIIELKSSTILRQWKCVDSPNLIKLEIENFWVSSRIFAWIDSQVIEKEVKEEKNDAH